MNSNQTVTLISHLIQALLGGLVAKGALDNSQAETFAGIGAGIFVWFITHVWHGDQAPPSGTNKISAWLLIGALAGTIGMTGCAGTSANVFAGEYAAASAVKAAMQSYAVYYEHAINDPTNYSRSVESLVAERQRVEAASIKLGTTIQLAENLRASYVTNAAVLPALQAVNATLASNAVQFVQFITAITTTQ